MKCVWNLGTPCDGEISVKKLFGQIEIPICKEHYNGHKKVIFVHEHGYEIEEYITLSSEEREKIFIELRKKFPNEVL